MNRRSKSNHWRTNQEKDVFVRRARTEGWRSRAVYKLEEIDRRQKLFKPGMTVVDLGAAPGSWSQYASFRLKGRGRIIALDLLAMDRLPDVEFIQGDFEEDTILDRLMDTLGNRPVDLVMSDMAPNISGMRVVDQPRAMALAEVARELATNVVKQGGSFVVKLFHGEGFDQYVRETRNAFESVSVKKPAASRSSSRETYLVARNCRV
ncbi:MAG: 23S rRNA methyltransferase [Gammaproteobacteria bacterium]|nr:23S rRNA methyltransferase [Gammaproteobacteria bacterium]MDH3768926.1 23S rRNA methyltransferase [Gammaproteobacteria bacterium]